MTDYLLTPPPELVEQWLTEGHHQDYCSATEHAIAQAARWGADQELEACCEWFQELYKSGDVLRAARRPKPPTLKEQALALVEQHEDGWRPSPKDWDTIRRALEQLSAPAPVVAPVPVSERLPRPEDVNENGNCWLWNRESCCWDWTYIRTRTRAEMYTYTHWLPANALPTPRGNQ